MASAGTRRVELLVPVRTLLIVGAAAGVALAFQAIGDTFLIVFIGIFLALVFEYPVRFVMAKTSLSRGLAATLTVLGTALAVIVFLPAAARAARRRVRDFLQELPTLVDQLRDVGRALVARRLGRRRERPGRARTRSPSPCPTRSRPCSASPGSFFGVFLAAFTILFICLFLLTRHRRTSSARSRACSCRARTSAGSACGSGSRVAISRWAIGVVVIAVIAGTTQGMTAWLLGSSYALGLGVIAGLLDMIPNIGATIAGFILVPTLWAEEGLTAAIIMLVVLLVYQQVENNILTPKIQGKAVKLSGFFIILAVTLFGALLGVLGALTAVPLAATVQIFVQELTKARREKVAEANLQVGGPAESA